MIILSNATLIILCVGILGFWLYLIYREIKEAQGNDRRVIIKQYMIIAVASLVLFAIARIFFASQLDQFYQWVSSINKPQPSVPPVDIGDLNLW